MNRWPIGSKRTNWAQANQNVGLALISGLGLGAGLMYLLDPKQGTRRRAEIWDQLTRAANIAGNNQRRMNMQEGGDRGKAPNVTGTQPKGRTTASPEKPGDKQLKGGAGKGAAKTKHAAKKAAGAKTSATRKAGPKKVTARTTSRSGEKSGR
jgi:hypothetical protein